MTVPAHDQHVTHSYVVVYPEHGPRAGDGHYRDFEAYRRKTHATARCQFAVETGVESECGGELQLHHAHIEWALVNEVDLAVLEAAYPGVSNADEVGAWVESAANLVWYCRSHHIGRGGVHDASASDFEAERFVRNLISGGGS